MSCKEDVHLDPTTGGRQKMTRTHRNQNKAKQHYFSDDDERIAIVAL